MIKELGIPVPETTTESEYEKLIAEDTKLYTKYFDAIRDYIIDNINRFSTKSLIKAMETYHEECEKPPIRRLKQAIDIYKYCKEHPNDVEENDNDFILGVLFVSNFVYCSHNSCVYVSANDEFSMVDNLLESNNIFASFGCGGGFSLIEIAEIGRVLKLLIPEFNVPQPKFHYGEGDRYFRGIEALWLLECEEVPQL